MCYLKRDVGKGRRKDQTIRRRGSRIPSRGEVRHGIVEIVRASGM